MPMVRFRMIGNHDDVETVISTLHGIDQIEHVEEVDDLMLGMRDDSSSANLVDDSEGKVFMVEVDTPNDLLADAVRGVAESRAAQLGAGIEFVDEF